MLSLQNKSATSCAAFELIIDIYKTALVKAHEQSIYST